MEQARRLRPWGTLLLAALLVSVWAAAEWAGGSTSPDVLVRLGARPAGWGFGVPAQTLVTSLLLHYGVWHLALNLAALVALGIVLESAVGPAWLWAAFFSSGLCGSLLSLEMEPRAASVGASGAIFGLAACLLVVLVRNPSRFEPAFRRSGIPLLLISLGLGLVGQVSGFPPGGGAVSGVRLDVYGHLGGLLGGLLFGLSLRQGGPRLSPHPAGLLLLAVLLAGGAAYVLRGPRLFL